MENRNSLMDSKFILLFFVRGRDHSWKRNGMKVAVKKRAAEEQKGKTELLVDS